MNRSARSVLIVVAAVAIAGLLTRVGFGIADNYRVTEEKLAEYTAQTDLKNLSGPARAEALRRLEQQVNGLSLEERRKWWLSGHWRKWFDEMTETEKNQYVDATLPVGFKQVLNAFEDLPEDQRKLAIDESIRKLRETHRLITDHEPGHQESMYGTNPAPILSTALENRARMLGFRTFYTQSSPETKAELAPLVEELQHQLQGQHGL